jgi:UPF0716 protein FxsA
MFFIPLPIVLIEILIFTTFVHFYNFWDVFFIYLIPSFAGAVLFSLTGRSMLMSLQGGMAQGQLPADRVLHKGAILLGSILLIVPTFLSRVLAVFLIVPLLRHISVYVFKNFIFKRMKNSPFSFVHFGGFPGGFPGGTPGGGGFQRGPHYQHYQGPFPFEEEPRQERDVDAVDITPLEITHTKITDDSSDSGDPNKPK